MELAAAITFVLCPVVDAHFTSQMQLARLVRSGPVTIRAGRLSRIRVAASQIARVRLVVASLIETASGSFTTIYRNDLTSHVYSPCPCKRAEFRSCGAPYARIPGKMGCKLLAWRYNRVVSYPSVWRGNDRTNATRRTARADTVERDLKCFYPALLSRFRLRHRRGASR